MRHLIVKIQEYRQLIFECITGLVDFEETWSQRIHLQGLLKAASHMI